MKNPRAIDINVVNAQQARRFLDRIVGYKLSPFLWKKVLMGLSAGRVQSIGMKFLADREREINAFKSDEYWTVSTSTNEGFEASVWTVAGNRIVSAAKDVDAAKVSVSKWTWLKDGDQAQVISKRLNNKTLEVSAYEKKPTKDYANPPFITSTLQQAAASRLGFDPDRTMRIAQKLYEGVEINGETKGLITYMRTDSFRVSTEAQNGAIQLVQGRWGNEYVPEIPNHYKSKKGSQDGHECVRPTSPDLMPDRLGVNLTSEEKKLYDLIWCRFMASQMAPARFDVATCDLKTDDVVLRATGRVTTFDGWTRAYGEENKDKSLPEMEIGKKVRIKTASADQHFTQPPPRYTSASLIKKLEADGVGRPSTYASIISTIQNRNYAEKIGQGGKAPLKATDIGMAVSAFMTGKFSIMDVGFTSRMEEELDHVAEGRADYKDVLRLFWEEFQKELAAAEKAPSVKNGTPTDEKCPKCSAAFTRRLSKYGYFLKCDECGEIKNGDRQERDKPQETGLKCDLCQADVVLLTGRFGPYLACSNYLKKEKKERVCQFTINIDKKGKPKRKLVPTPTDVVCDKCKKQMVIRVASRKKQPNPFLSCSGFPKCRNAKELPSELEGKGEETMVRFRDNREKDAKDADKFTAEVPEQESRQKGRRQKRS
jgi:DNA topoisomerase-1